MNWTMVVAVTSGLSSILVVIFAAFLYKHFSAEIKVLFYMLAFTGLVDAISFLNWLSDISIETVWISHIITLLHYCTFMWIFSVWSENLNVKKAKRWSILVFVLFWALAKLTLEDFSKYDDITSPIASVILMSVAASIIYSRSLISEVNLFQDTRFLISTGAMIYFAGNLVLSIMVNKMISTISIELTTMLWTLSWTLTFIANLLYAKGFLCQRAA